MTKNEKKVLVVFKSVITRALNPSDHLPKVPRYQLEKLAQFGGMQFGSGNQESAMGWDETGIPVPG